MIASSVAVFGTFLSIYLLYLFFHINYRSFLGNLPPFDINYGVPELIHVDRHWISPVHVQDNTADENHCHEKSQQERHYFKHYITQTLCSRKILSSLL